MQLFYQPTIEINIYMAGDIAEARKVCRFYCLKVGLCVTITATTFTYTGGEEEGFIIGVRNYPRFPSTRQKLRSHAENITRKLIDNLYQHSAMIVDNEETVWMTNRE